MKKLFTVLFLSAFLFTFFSSTSFAQFHLSVAPALGMNFNLHTGSDLPESGSGFGLVFGGYADMQFTPSIGLISGLAFYDNRSGSYSSTVTDNSTGQPVNLTIDNDASLAYFQIENLFKLTTPAKIYFVIGPVLGFNISSEGEQTVTIATPGYTFPDGNTKSTSKATIKDTQVRFELKAGAGFDITLSQLMTLAPQVTFGYGITNVQKEIKWRVLTIQGLVSIKFKLI